MKYTDHHIQQYLSWKMPQVEHQEFEAELTANPNLATRVVIHKHLRDDIRKSHIREILKQEVKPVVKDRQFQRPLLLAASIAILISIGFWFYPSEAPRSNSLYAKYDRLPDRIGSPVMGPTSPESFLNHSQYAMMAYEAGEFEKAMEDFKALQDAFPQNDSLQFYQGSTFLGLQQSDSAILYFEQVLAHAESRYKYDAQWYKLLAYLQADKLGEAQRYLDELDPWDNHPYREQLEEIQIGLSQIVEE